MTTEKATDILADLGIDVMNDGKMQANSKGGQAYLDGYENFVDPLLEIKRGAYKQAKANYASSMMGAGASILAAFFI